MVLRGANIESVNLINEIENVVARSDVMCAPVYDNIATQA